MLLEGPAGTSRPQVFCSVPTRLTYPNLILAATVDLAKSAPSRATETINSNHNFEISRPARYIRHENKHIEQFLHPKRFWNHQNHVHFGLARCDFRDYITLVTWWNLLCSDSLWKPAFGRDYVGTTCIHYWETVVVTVISYWLSIKPCEHYSSKIRKLYFSLHSMKLS